MNEGVLANLHVICWKYYCMKIQTYLKVKNEETKLTVCCLHFINSIRVVRVVVVKLVPELQTNELPCGMREVKLNSFGMFWVHILHGSSKLCNLLRFLPTHLHWMEKVRLATLRLVWVYENHLDWPTKWLCECWSTSLAPEQSNKSATTLLPCHHTYTEWRESV